jgi:hypothetical protein
MLTNMLICLMILAMFIIIGAIVTKSPLGDLLAGIISIIYMLPMFVVLLTVAIVSMPIHWISKRLSK